ncbi:DNA cytosine methyltransferase [Sphingobacterium chuzhouense]|uniref:DNA (cytosine-5-)-methyltransferase n=1 Tax=Sphingobacterium chuzhouense TaxID=1742264 RepID=A0ABR7XR61_9SPHI|nr:DNA cytosine methyltransferase [Sphingobacterium chuzhouense]MBD1421628.1 DNA cytosine methyltransferase [Sphingobacterium chuzhouense]
MSKIDVVNQQQDFLAVDIFSGAGGLSLGAEMAGIKVLVAVEKDKSSALTFKKNHPHSKVIIDDIRKIDPLKVAPKDPFILFGGPPCQGFSSSNTKSRNLDNPNNHLFHEFVRFVRVLEPKWFLFENVEGITTFDKGNTVVQIKELFEELGYSTNEKVLCAADYGVPQNRNRFIMVGNRIGIDFVFPKPFEQKITVGDAFEDLPSLSNGDLKDKLPYGAPISKGNQYAKLMRSGLKKCRQNLVSRNKEYVIERYKYIKPGQNWQAIPEELMQNYKDRNNCHSGIYRRLDPTKTSVVISNYRKNMLIHPFEDRGLSVREAARLQSFPDNFCFEGTLIEIQQQIGNAVPPLLAKEIFKKIIECNTEYGSRRV